MTAQAYDVTEQSGLPGVLAPFRHVSFATYFEPNPGSAGVLSVDPVSGGKLSLTSTGGPGLALQMTYGDWERPMHLDLSADGSDRIEIDIPALSLSSNFASLHVVVMLHRGTGISAQSAGESYLVTGPGTLIVPYSDLAGLEAFIHDVESIEVHFNFNHALSPGELAVGEIRTGSTTTAAERSSWGKIKNAYRR